MAVLDAQEALLATWNRWAQVARSDEPWVDGRNRDLGRNSIMDAELLECILLPQFYLDRFSLGDPADADESVAAVLNQLDPEARLVEGQLAPGVITEIVERLEDFLSRYRSDSGVDVFSPGGYLETAEGKRTPDALPWVVDSFTMSVSVCLHALYLLGRWREGSSRRFSGGPDADHLEDLRARLSKRLTSAMLGLCRSFAVTVDEQSDWEEVTKRSWPRGSTGRTLGELGRRLRMFADSAPTRGKAFECGWSWGPTPPDFFESEYQEVDAWPAQEVYAEPAPYLYFTIGAIDGIGDLFSRKITAAHLLTPQQSALATRLGFYRECASSYWSTLAFAEGTTGSWAVEDPPWRTADGNASDYWTLYLLTIALASDEARETFGGEQKLGRLLSLLEELAQRGRVTRRPHPPGMDPAVDLHVPPGQQLTLKTVVTDGSPSDIAFRWSIYDFAPRLLKLVGQVLSIATERNLRDRASQLINDIWAEHLDRRRVERETDAYAWDDVREVFKDYPVDTSMDDKAKQTGAKVGSWYITERVVEALVAVVSAQQRKTGGRLTGNLVTEVLDDLRWMIAARYSDDSAMARRIAEATDLVEKSPTLALGVAVEISQSAEKKKRAQEQDTAEHSDDGQ